MTKPISWPPFPVQQTILACVLASFFVYALLIVTIRIHAQSKDRLVRVTLVPLISSIAITPPSMVIGPFECLEARAFPDQFYCTTVSGDVAYQDLRDMPYAAIVEPVK